MKNIFKPILLLLMVSLAGCQITPEAMAETTPNAELRNTLWKLTELNGQSVKTSNAKRMASLTLGGEDAAARIVTACNRGSAGFTHKGASLKFGLVAATKMMCPAEQMQEEAAFFKAIQNTSRYEIKGESLQLFDADNQRLASFHSEYL